jgi:phosphatidylglycerol:prolipoprotein diacylglycerol transferase
LNFPLNIKIGLVEIPSHLLCEIAAYAFGFRYYVHLRKKGTDLISDENRIWIFIGAAAGALLFSRLIGVLEDPVLLSKNGSNVIYYMSSKTIVGGLFGGLIGVELTKKLIGVNTSSGDLLAYPIILAMIIGRVGCFLAGMEDGTYGIASSLPWALDMGDGIRRHPTNLYEIMFFIFIWVLLLAIEKKWVLVNGARFKILLASYFLFRFLDEFIKPEFRFGFGLGVLQLVCLAGILYYYKVFLFPRRLVGYA